MTVAFALLLWTKFFERSEFVAFILFNSMVDAKFSLK